MNSRCIDCHLYIVCDVFRPLADRDPDPGRLQPVREPDTGNPRCTSTMASPLMLMPPIPIKCVRTGLSKSIWYIDVYSALVVSASVCAGSVACSASVDFSIPV